MKQKPKIQTSLRNNKGTIVRSAKRVDFRGEGSSQTRKELREEITKRSHIAEKIRAKYTNLFKKLYKGEH